MNRHAWVVAVTLLFAAAEAGAQEPPARWSVGLTSGAFGGEQAGVDISRSVGSWRGIAGSARLSALGTFEDGVPGCAGNCSSLLRRRSRATATLEFTGEWPARPLGASGLYALMSGGISATSWLPGSHGYAPPVVYRGGALTGAPVAGVGAGRQFQLFRGANRVEFQFVRFFDHDKHITSGRLTLARLW